MYGHNGTLQWLLKNNDYSTLSKPLIKALIKLEESDVYGVRARFSIGNLDFILHLSDTSKTKTSMVGIGRLPSPYNVVWYGVDNGVETWPEINEIEYGSFYYTDPSGLYYNIHDNTVVLKEEFYKL